MELNYVMTIVDRERAQTMETICQNLKLPLTLTMLCQGTATGEHLSLYGLVATEKALVFTVADGEQTKKLMLEVQAQLAELQAKYEAQQKARDEAEARSAETTTAPSEE